MPNLKEIDMNRNKLKYNERSFPGNSFENLPHLKSVSIIEPHVPLVEPTMEDFEFMIQKLPITLEEISILIPERDGFSSRFAKFAKLRKLTIVTSIFRTVTNATFKYLENLPLTDLSILCTHLRHRTSGFLPIVWVEIANIEWKLWYQPFRFCFRIDRIAEYEN